MNKRIISDTIKLVVITLVAGVLLSFVYQLTKDTIKTAVDNERAQSYKETFADAAGFESAGDAAELSGRYPEIFGSEYSLNEALYAKDSNGENVGCVLSLTAHNGYGGDIVLSMGINKSGEITGVKVTSMSETPSLGAICQDEDWIAQFSGISGNVKYTKTGKTQPDEIDAISGATFTTKAVTGAVNSGLDFAKSCFGFGNESEGAK